MINDKVRLITDSTYWSCSFDFHFNNMTNRDKISNIFTRYLPTYKSSLN